MSHHGEINEGSGSVFDSPRAPADRIGSGTENPPNPPVEDGGAICPRCQATGDEPCRDRGGRPRGRHHTGRLRAVESTPPPTTAELMAERVAWADETLPDLPRAFVVAAYFTIAYAFPTLDRAGEEFIERVRLRARRRLAWLEEAESA